MCLFSGRNRIIEYPSKRRCCLKKAYDALLPVFFKILICLRRTGILTLITSLIAAIFANVSPTRAL